MVKKLKGKATEELKGKFLRKRNQEYEEARQLLIKISPFIIIFFLLLIAYFTYKIYK